MVNARHAEEIRFNESNFHYFIKYKVKSIEFRIETRFYETCFVKYRFFQSEKKILKYQIAFRIHFKRRSFQLSRTLAI